MTKRVLELLKQCDALIQDTHVVLVSGRHSNAYINPDKVLPHTRISAELGKLMAQACKATDIDIVIGPAYGGIIFAQWTAYYLSQIQKRDIPGIFTEKTPERHQIFERGFDAMVSGKQVLIVEDITATGSSVIKVMKAVTAAGGIVARVCVIVNRDADRVNAISIGAPFTALAEYRIDSYDESSCPLCKKKVPINSMVGHGKKFLERKK